MYELAGRESKNKSEKHMSELSYIPIKFLTLPWESQYVQENVT